jgi:tetratricopeptide (TPR) repeat protein
VPAPTADEPSSTRDHGARATELLARQMPRVAQRAERAVLRVLFVAAQADDAAEDEAIRAAARALPRAHDLGAEIASSPREARALNEAARTALWRQGNVQEALRLHLRAFGANPLDAEIVGNTAFLLLRQAHPDAEAARQLALHALTLRDPRFPAGRIEDWSTLAIASSLTGNERDARNAWFVSLALAPSLERLCRAAINARSIYGDRLRGPIEAMLERAQASGRSRGAPACDGPPPWVASNQGR